MTSSIRWIQQYANWVLLYCSNQFRPKSSKSDWIKLACSINLKVGELISSLLWLNKEPNWSNLIQHFKSHEVVPCVEIGHVITSILEYRWGQRHANITLGNLGYVEVILWGMLCNCRNKCCISFVFCLFSISRSCLIVRRRKEPKAKRKINKPHYIKDFG